jgi:hypothetical protein
MDVLRKELERKKQERNGLTQAAPTGGKPGLGRSSFL